LLEVIELSHKYSYETAVTRILSERERPYISLPHQGGLASDQKP
jgi:hypothetical protein